MEKLFKQNLLNLRNPQSPSTFSEALLGQPCWIQKRPSQKVVTLKNSDSEKKQVIESLENFALTHAVDGKVQLDQAEIVLKQKTAATMGELLDYLRPAPEVLKVLLSSKALGEVRVIFITENLRCWDEVVSELKTGFINELLMGLPLKTAEFFERMIYAMKLLPEEVIVYPIDDAGVDLSGDIFSLSAYFKPEIVITLGAKATSKILKSNDRLSLVHGQFFTRESELGSSFQIVPLFHPSIIETNLNMKKTAWVDMQKIMKHLKKLS